MGSSKRLAPLYDMYAAERQIITAAKSGPLQSLTAAELEQDSQPVTIYPRPAKVRAWVRFGPAAVRVDAFLVRSTPHSAGVEFTAGGETYRCWVWGNAVTVPDEA